MCGIAGMMGDRWTEADFWKLFHSIKHRGPDDSGTMINKSAYLGMHRLHLRGQTAQLPLKIDNKYIAFNGQVYCTVNANGHLEEIEDGLTNEINAICNGKADGMFAIAYIDTDFNSLSLRSDRYFNKPMFYFYNGTDIAFCSELTPLVSILKNPVIDSQALAGLFRFGWYLSPELWIKDLNALIGHDLERHERTFNKVPKSCIMAKEKKVSQLKEMVKFSVAMCIRGSGPFGIALSGGLDSTILAYELNELGMEEITTFSFVSADNNDGIRDLKSLGFKGKGAWEKWKHVVVELDDEDELVSGYESSVSCFGHPTTMSSLPLTWQIAKKAKEYGIRVMLTGEGVDELFCGYTSYHKLKNNSDILGYYRSTVRESLILELFGQSKYDLSWSRFYEKYQYTKDIREIEIDIRLSRLLLRNDICFMHHSIESRTPFLHHGIPELAMSIPWQKLAAPPGKSIVRAAWNRELGERSAIQKSRFKMEDVTVRRMFNRKDLKERVIRNGSKIFGADAVKSCCLKLQTESGFDHDVANLLISLGLLTSD
jgi:asparagine synthase (glutamine-hydrolysing)